MRSRRLALLCVCGLCQLSLSQDSSWKTYDPGFRVLNIASDNAKKLWVCGVGEAIAVSSDDGVHWQLKHQAADGGALLNISFTNSSFGYATGTLGLFLTTDDGGDTWKKHAIGSDSILLASFSDSQHGLIRTNSSLLFTADGGTHWSKVSDGQNTDELKRFPYTFYLVALDAMHMAVLIKEGMYSEGGFLTTSDGGKTWKFLDIPSIAVGTLLKVDGKYLAVGTEVIEKDKPGGGHSVPLALVSTDGENWQHSAHDISKCRLEGCQACKPQGCLASNGILALIFDEKTEYAEFPPNKEMTARWAATDSTLCTVSNAFECVTLSKVADSNNFNGPAPTVFPPRPLGASLGSGPACLSCDVDPLYLDHKVHGSFTLKLSLEIARNGTVKNVTVEGAPSKTIEDTIRQRAQLWIFEPYLKDGSPAELKLNTSLRITVITPR